MVSQVLLWLTRVDAGTMDLEKPFAQLLWSKVKSSQY